MASGLHEFATSKLRTFATLRLRMFMASGLHKFAISRLRRFETLDHREFFDPKTHFTNFMNLNVSRVTGFPEFPNRSKLK
jgi:hypothetical protein